MRAKAVSEAHETLSSPATRRILERKVQLYGKQEYARLAAISVAHLYNLRKSQRYRERRLTYVKTRPTAVSIGGRRKPQPQGQPGCLYSVFIEYAINPSVPGKNAGQKLLDVEEIHGPKGRAAGVRIDLNACFSYGLH